MNPRIASASHIALGTSSSRAAKDAIYLLLIVALSLRRGPLILTATATHSAPHHENAERDHDERNEPRVFHRDHLLI
jgi:hypothetical protein